MHRRDLTALDRIGVALVAAAALVLFDLPLHVLPAFRGMFRDFGGSLPAVTTLVPSPWFAPALAVAPLGLGLAAVVPPVLRLESRRRFIVAAFVADVAVIGFCIVGLYMPIFEMAGNIRAD